MRVTLATCARKPEPDPDEALLALALRRAGAAPQVLAWDDPDAPWGSAPVCVLRSTWNYPHHAAEFAAWVRRASAVTRLYNPREVVEWNLHKGYLAALADRGVPVIETVYLARGAAPSLAGLLAERGWARAVVKPAVSAASFATWRVRRDEAEAGQARLDADVAARDTMVQPYLAAIEDAGERSLVWIDGALTHAVRKAPRWAGQDEHASPSTVPIAEDERAVAEAALAGLAGELLYARVDLVRDDAGAPRLMELELIEPSLFLLQHPPALTRLAAAVVRRAAM